ncbi:MAG: FG-GAP-like repeat-containing protein, partial [bacterium]|nr:FG-GAP-like repeat-containing protein [bacterium]
PEAISTTGRGGLNGTLARFFASHLGLPGLSDFENDLPAVGDWSLMDTGANNLIEADRMGLLPNPTPLETGSAGNTLIGFLPSLPMAWSRMRLGWITPITITRSDTVQIAAAHLQSDLPGTVKIPVSATEYFLIENRISRLKVHGQKPALQLSEPNGVWLSIDDHDAFIPGSGILIWHIDDAVINASSDRKNINSNPDYEIAFTQYRRGVALEEADGLLDIGNVSASRVIQNGIISFSTIEGSETDPFFVGNNSVFGPETTPNSNSNLSYPTGITIEILSPPSDTMTVAIRFAQHRDLWPVTTGHPTTHAPRSLDLDGDGIEEILLSISGAPETSSAWQISGAPYTVAGAPFELVSSLTPAIGRVSPDAESDEIVYHRGGNARTLWRRPNDSLTEFVPMSDPNAYQSSPAVIADFAGASRDIWGWSSGLVEWGEFQAGSRGVTHIGAAVASLAVGNIDGDSANELVAITNNGQVHLIRGTQQDELIATLDPLVGSAALADLDHNGLDEIVVVTTEGRVCVLSADGLVYQSDPVTGGATSSPVLADLDADGFIEVLFGGVGRIWVFRLNGILQNGGALSFPLKDAPGGLSAPPVIADINSDGRPEIIVGSLGGLVYGLSAEGAPLPGFPVSMSGPIAASPLLTDLDGDGTLELVVFSTHGALQIFHLENLDPTYTGNRVIWGQMGGGPGNAGKLLQQAGPEIERPLLTGLLPPNRAYVYPNPIRSGDRAKIRFYLTDSAQIRATIYNPLGDQVDELQDAQALPNTENEISWDVSDYASGFYICRLEATNGPQKDVRFIKVAIIK